MAIVAGIAAKFGYQGLAICTLMAGVILIIMGLARLGSLIKFIPYPVTTGFTSGIAVIIFSSQVKDFLGLPIAKLPAGFAEQWAAMLPALGTTSLLAAGFGLGSLLIMIAIRKWAPKVPGAIVVVIISAVLTAMLGLDALGSALLKALGAQQPDMSMLNPRTVGVLLAGVVAIGVTAGILEEPVFRGVALRGLGTVAGKWAAILLSSFVFALVHAEAAGFVIRFLIGVVLGMMAWRSGSVVPGIFTHIVYNSSALLTAYVFTAFLPDWQGFSAFASLWEEGANVATMVVLSLPFIALSIGAYWLFARVTPKSAEWNRRPYAPKPVKASHWLPWVAAIVLTEGMTLTTAAMMWMPSLDELMKQFGNLPK
jgi:membrane protease YdiL (CAAX protease family)